MADPAEVIDTASPGGDVGGRAAIAFDCPLGRTVIEADDFGLLSLGWGQEVAGGDGPPGPPTPLLIEARDQVLAYFDGRLRRFSLPLAPRGTRFQRTVWGFLNEIPFGFVLTYGELGALAGGVPRAVGRACGANPLPLIIPCHRVVAATGLGGYSGAGGLDSKRLLLALEGAGDGPRRVDVLPRTGRRHAVGATA